MEKNEEDISNIFRGKDIQIYMKIVHKIISCPMNLVNFLLVDENGIEVMLAIEEFEIRRQNSNDPLCEKSIFLKIQDIQKVEDILLLKEALIKMLTMFNIELATFTPHIENDVSRNGIRIVFKIVFKTV